MEALNVAINALDKAKQYLKTNQSQNIVSSVGKDIKLKLDKELNEIIVNSLMNDSEYSIVSEECDYIGGVGDKVWIVDPLDGSLNYSRGINMCAISIALCQNNDPIFGLVYDIFNDDLYIANDGMSYCNGNIISVSNIKDIGNSIISTGFPVNTSFDDSDLLSFIELVKQYKKVRLFGSASLSLCFVASGKIEAYRENDIMIWDVAAGLALCKFAGANIFVGNGRVKNSLNVFVSNKAIENETVEEY